MPPQDIDWDRERQRASSQTQRSLIALARRAGYEVEPARGKGSHVRARLPGMARPVFIQHGMSKQVAQAIIDALRDGIREAEHGSG